jgi:hypothetical protein
MADMRCPSWSVGEGANDPVVIMTTQSQRVNTVDTYDDTSMSTTVDTDGSASQSEDAEARHAMR